MQEARKKLQNKPRRRKRRRRREEEEEKEEEQKEGRKGKHNIMSEIRETECRNKTLSWFLEKVVKYTNSI